MIQGIFRLKFTTPQVAVILLSILAWIHFIFIERSNFTILIANFIILFILFILGLRVKFNWKKVLLIGVLFRLILLFMTPNLSQDFYRFIWDGNLVASGLNPYLKTPTQWMLTPNIIDNQDILFEKMGSLSASNFSNYPPFNQYLFAISSWLGGGSIWATTLIMRIQIILADIGLFIIGFKFLRYLGKSENLAYLFFLNPFVIAELTGNLHYEGVMMFFLLASFYFLNKNHWIIAAIFWALSINTKLLPLMLLPLFFRFFDWKKLLLFYSIIGVTSLTLFIPYISISSSDNYVQTIALWFNSFEFNASFYYLLRWVGFEISGYNQILIIGKILAGLILILISLVSFRKSNAKVIGLIKNSYIILIGYFLLSTTVHPWYVISPLTLSLFTNSKIALVWSFLVLLSYSAYQQSEVKELPVLLLIQYGILLIIMGLEIVQIKKNYELNFFK